MDVTCAFITLLSVHIVVLHLYQLLNLITVIETRKLPSSNSVLTSDRKKERMTIPKAIVDTTRQ